MGDEEKISLILEIKAKGVNGVTTEVRKLDGTISDLTDELNKLSSSSSGFSTHARRQFQAVGRSLIQLKAEAVSAGRALDTVFASNIGTRKSRITGSTSSEGAELKNVKQINAAHREAIKENARFDKALKAQIAAEERQAARQQAKALNDIEKEAARQHRQEIRDQRQNQRDFSRGVAGKDRADASAREKAAFLARGTVGFVGVNLSQQLGGILDPLKAKGIIAPNIAKIGELVGGLFGQTFASVFKNLGDAAGRLFEIVFDSIGLVARAGIKFVSGIMQGFFTALIASFGGGTLLLGVIGGALLGIVSAVGSIIKDLVDIVSNLFSAITSLISAGFSIVKAVFEGAFNVLKNIWTGFWEGLKSIAEFTMEAIADVVHFGVDQITKGFGEFVESEKLAAKSFANIIETVDKYKDGFLGGVEATRQLGSELRVQFGRDSAETQGAIFSTLSAGFAEAADSSKILTAAGKLATIGQSDYKTTTDTLLTSLLAYGKGAESAAEQTGLLFGIVHTSRTDLDGLNSSLGKSIAQAATSGVSLQELGTAFSVATRSGLNAATAMTGINRLLLTLENPTKQNAKAFEELGVELKTVGADGKEHLRPFLEIMKDIFQLDPNNLRKLFGTSQGIRIYEALKNNAGLIPEIFAKIGVQAGLMDKAFEGNEKIFDFMIRKITQIGLVARENLGKGFGELFRESIEKIIPKFERLESVMNGQNVQKFFTAFKEYAKPIIDEVLNPILGLMDSLSSIIETTNFDKLFKTEGAIVLRDAVIRLVRYIYSLPKALEESLGIFTAIKEIAIGIYQSAIVPIFNILTDKKLFNNIQEGFEVIKPLAKDIGDIIQQSFGDPEKFKQNFTAVFEFMKTSIKTIGSGLLTILVSAFEIASEFFAATLGAKLKSALSGLFIDLFGGISNSIGNEIVRLEKTLIPENALNPFNAINQAKNAVTNAKIESLSATKSGFDLFSSFIKPAASNVNGDTSDVFRSGVLPNLIDNKFSNSRILDEYTKQGINTKSDYSNFDSAIKNNPNSESGARKEFLKNSGGTEEDANKKFDQIFAGMLQLVKDAASGDDHGLLDKGVARDALTSINETVATKKAFDHMAEFPKVIDDALSDVGNGLKESASKFKETLKQVNDVTFQPGDRAVSPPKPPDGEFIDQDDSKSGRAYKPSADYLRAKDYEDEWKSIPVPPDPQEKGNQDKIVDLLNSIKEGINKVANNTGQLTGGGGTLFPSGGSGSGYSPNANIYEVAV